jgi:hypothetical protein
MTTIHPAAPDRPGDRVLPWLDRLETIVRKASAERVRMAPEGRAPAIPTANWQPPPLR